MYKTMCRAICNEPTTHHYKEKTISFRDLVAGQVKKEQKRQFQDRRRD